MIRSDVTYTTDGLMLHCGIGHELLSEMRRSGMVTPIEVGRRLYYLGREVNAWIESKKTRNKAAE